MVVALLDMIYTGYILIVYSVRFGQELLSSKKAENGVGKLLRKSRYVLTRRIRVEFGLIRGLLCTPGCFFKYLWIENDDFLPLDGNYLFFLKFG